MYFPRLNNRCIENIAMYCICNHVISKAIETIIENMHEWINGTFMLNIPDTLIIETFISNCNIWIIKVEP